MTANSAAAELAQRILGPYCNDLARPTRLRTHEVTIGDLRMGGPNPIVVQSMTTTDTLDTEATVAQSIRMIEAGCELVRITAPSKTEAQNLANIRAELRRRGYHTPLVADIHFTPNAAEIAARIVEKVRINPGNYADKKKFETLEYTAAAYQAELERIYERFAPLVRICKEYGTAMRIGTNHGSLSDRILSRYGDTPEGMVESALEFVRICEDLGYHNLVISMKASNTLVMVQAYRLLCQRMLAGATRYVYPLHLGVTEAGEGEDGRIKSAQGIGALLADGIGDTIRVSLTEAPEAEIPVARYLVQHLHRRAEAAAALAPPPPVAVVPNPFSFQRRNSRSVANFGGGQLPRVIAHMPQGVQSEADLVPLGHLYDAASDKWNMTDMGADYIWLADRTAPFMLPNGLRAVYAAQSWADLSAARKAFSYPCFESPSAWLAAEARHPELNFVRFAPEQAAEMAALPVTAPIVGVLHDSRPDRMQRWRQALSTLQARGADVPVVLEALVEIDSQDTTQTDQAKYQIAAAADTSIALVDGWLDGLWLSAPPDVQFPPAWANRTAFGLLQAARQRITRTEYISCPSCGRTLFDLEETTARIRQRTEHLKGVKIGIMGCIVNGPGEMADADFGYVGSGPGIITLYKGQEVIRRNVPTAEAVDALIDLIRAEGQWMDPPNLPSMVSNEIC